MQNSNAENNKRIAKILTLGVGLYTSREVLAQLGVSDFLHYLYISLNRGSNYASNSYRKTEK